MNQTISILVGLIVIIVLIYLLMQLLKETQGRIYYPLSLKARFACCGLLG